ncbi:MAG: DUF5666 domain-containing protein [Vicinamibacterales bacterium]
MIGLPGVSAASQLQDQALGLLAGSQQLHVEGKAMVTAVTGACPDVVLTVAGIPVTVNASTTFPFGQNCGQLAANQVVEIRGTLTITGTTLTVVAQMIDIEDGPGEGEGEGRVTDVQGTCPDLTITVDGLTVKADALTRYLPSSKGASCGLIKVGTKIKVKAVPLAGGGFRARTIEIKGQRHFGQGEGRITSVTGVCPDVTIYFGNLAIMVNAATVFDRGTCGDLAAGVKVEARGFNDDGNGPNVATYIKFKSRHVEGRSTISSVSGSCPDLTIMIGGVKIVTDANTVYRNGSCANLRAGTKVKVKGDMQNADGSVIAEEIDIEDQPGGKPGGRVEGRIGTLTGTCPALTMVINGVSVMTTAATRFDHVSCASLKAGVKVEVEGDIAGGSLLATKVELDD